MVSSTSANTDRPPHAGTQRSMADNAPEPTARKAVRQAAWRTSTQTTSLVLAVVVLVGIIGGLYLAQASRTAATGRRLQALEAKRQTLEQHNAQLRAEIAALRSVPKLTGDAETEGFRPATSAEVEYLFVEEVPPLLPPTPTPLPTGDDLVPQYEETLEGWLQGQLASFRQQMRLFVRNTFRSEQSEPRRGADDAPAGDEGAADE